MKIEVSALQRANAEFAAYVMWPSVPPENVARSLGFWAKNLNGYQKVPSIRQEIRVATCGTIACFGGWVAQNPYFHKQGVSPDCTGSPEIVDHHAWAPSVSLVLFGDSTLFDIRQVYERGTPHEVVAQRLAKLIANSVVVGRTK